MPALQQREFDKWCRDDAAFKKRVLDYIEYQTNINLATERRLTKLETDDQRRSNVRYAAISITSSVFGALIGVFGGYWFGVK